MRYINVFCGRYSLATGTRFIAWFYIVLYLINIILNIAAADIVKSYKENVDEDTDYDRYKLLTFHYICLTFGVVTILLSTAFLVKFSESEDFVNFMVKWNIVRCFFAFAAIIYVAVDMNHILTASVSSVMIIIDLCASTYFTGVMASYIKELEDPNGQVYSSQQRSNGEQSVYLVSHKRSLHTENKVSYVNEVAVASPERPGGFVEIPLNDEAKKDTETNHNSITTTNIKRTEKENCVSTTAVEDGGDTNQELNTKLQQLENIEKEQNEFTGTNEKSASNCTRQGDNTEPLGMNRSSFDTERNSEMMNQDTNETDKNSEDDTRNLINNESTENDTNGSKETEATVGDSDIQTECEKQEPDSENQQNNDTEVSEKSGGVKEVESPAVFSEKSCDEKGIENPAVDHMHDVSETESPSVVIIPASPDQEVGLRLGIKIDDGDEGKDNPAFEEVEAKLSEGV